MINIGQIHNFLEQRNTTLTKSQSITKEDKQSFSYVLHREKKELGINPQQNFKKPESLKADRSQISRQEAEKLTVQSNGSQIKEINNISKDTKALDAKKKAEKSQLTTEENEVKVKTKAGGELLDHIVSLLQSLLTTIQVEVRENENTAEAEIELDIDQLQSLLTLKDELANSLNPEGIELDEMLKENIVDILPLIEKLTEKTSTSSKEQLVVTKQSADEVVVSLEALKDHIKPLLNISNSIKNKNIQNLNAKNNYDLFQKEENISFDQEVEVTEVFNTEDAKVKIEYLDKDLLKGDNEEEIFKGTEHGKELIFNDEILALKQETSIEKINVAVIKDKIVEPKQFINEIGQKAAAFLSKDRNEMSIQLTPENLGKISIKIGLNDGSLTGKIYAENYSVKEIIETNLNQLKNALEEKGLNISGLEVHVGHNSQGFERGLYQSKMPSKQKNRGSFVESSNMVSIFEEENNHINPYLISSQFEGSI